LKFWFPNNLLNSEIQELLDLAKRIPFQPSPNDLKHIENLKSNKDLSKNKFWEEDHQTEDLEEADEGWEDDEIKSNRPTPSKSVVSRRPSNLPPIDPKFREAVEDSDDDS